MRIIIYLYDLDKNSKVLLHQVKGEHEKDITNSEEVIYISYNNI